MGGSGRPALTLAALLLLAGCAGGQAPARQAALEETAEEQTVEEPAAAALPAEPEPAPAPAPPPKPPVPDARTFLDRNGADISGVLGEPGFVRKDPPAELWQYRAERCTLDLYFYDDGGGAYSLAWLDFRGTDGSLEARDDCLREILGLPTG